MCDERVRWPKISIITPSFNQGSYIEETILSVLNQNYPNLEYIIIDGDSNDNTKDIIGKFDDRLYYWISEKDRGQSHALNKGLSQASGDIIGYLNSDDCLLAGALLSVATAYIEFRKTCQLPVILSGHAQLGEKISVIRSSFLSEHPDWTPAGVAAGYGICPQPATFWTKSDILFNEDLVFCMDFDYWFKLINEGYQLLKINKDLSFYRLHHLAKGNLMISTMWLEAVKLCYTHAGLLKETKDKLIVIQSARFKLRNYYIEVLRSESGNVSKATLVKHMIQMFKSNLQVCLNFRFIKFAACLLVTNNKHGAN